MEKSYILLFLLSYLIWYLQASIPDYRLDRAQPVLQFFRNSEEDKEAMTQKVEAEHLPMTRWVSTFLSIFLSGVMLLDVAVGPARSNHMQLYLDYGLYTCCLLCAIPAATTHLPLDSLFQTCFVAVAVGVAHTFISEPSSIVLATPVKLLQHICATAMLADCSFGALGFFSACVDLLRLYNSQLDGQKNLVFGIVLTELGSSLVTVVWTVLLREHMMREPDQQVVEVKQFFHEHSAARRMLAVLCDAQVYLGQDLNIISHCRGLAQLLMSTSSSKALEGRVFQDFLAPRDRPRFQTFVESAVQVFLDDDEGPEGGRGWAGSTGRCVVVHTAPIDDLALKDSV
eukprot:g21057.t1